MSVSISMLSLSLPCLFTPKAAPLQPLQPRVFFKSYAAMLDMRIDWLVNVASLVNKSFLKMNLNVANSCGLHSFWQHLFIWFIRWSRIHGLYGWTPNQQKLYSRWTCLYLGYLRVEITIAVRTLYESQNPIRTYDWKTSLDQGHNQSWQWISCPTSTHYQTQCNQHIGHDDAVVDNFSDPYGFHHRPLDVVSSSWNSIGFCFLWSLRIDHSRSIPQHARAS